MFQQISGTESAIPCSPSRAVRSSLPGQGWGVTAVTVAPFMYLENAEIVLNGVGLLQVSWSW